MRKTDPNEPGNSKTWSPRKRRIVSAILLFHLFAVIFAPLTMDRGFAGLFGSWSWVRDYTVALYLDHGYRFFAPDPGPTHTIQIEFVDDQGNAVRRRIPDRDSTWPRLLYHRWFMLGESLAFEIGFSLVQAGEFHQIQSDLRSELDELHRAGRMREATWVRDMLAQNQEQFEGHRHRLTTLVDALRDEWTRRVGGYPIRIFSRRQLIPTPQDMRLGKPIESDELVEFVDLTRLDQAFSAADPEVVAPPGEDDP